MTALAADAERVRRALLAGAAVLERHAAADVPFEVKHGHGPVTAADREVDALLRDALPQPGDGWLSEETDDDEARLSCARVWVVDPLDGTRAFVAKRPEYSISIALVVDGEPALGGIANPRTGVTVLGGPGLGIEVTGSPGLHWPEGDLPHVLASRSEWKRGEWNGTATLCHVLPVSSVAYKLALVAAGFADATWTLQPKHEWDVAGGAALVLGAGGDVWRPDGAPLQWNRRAPRLPGFAACGPGRRERVESLLRSRRG